MKILSFGEILWDAFDEEKKIGGAPFNFAAHMAKLGAESYMVSALGNDENGIEALEEVKKLGIKTDFITKNSFKTGYCRVTLKNGKPSYFLAPDVAYDHIGRHCPLQNFDALYMGTLALRSAESRRSFEALMKCVKAKEVFFDVNIRGNNYTKELLSKLLSVTDILKVSDEEINVFGRGNDIIKICLDLSDKYKNLSCIAVTLGKNGAMVFDCKNKTALFSDVPSGKAVSTVGAGDSFSACFLYNRLMGEPLDVCLDRAVVLSDYVVTQLGAVPDYPAELISKIK